MPVFSGAAAPAQAGANGETQSHSASETSAESHSTANADSKTGAATTTPAIAGLRSNTFYKDANGEIPASIEVGIAFWIDCLERNGRLIYQDISSIEVDPNLHALGIHLSNIIIFRILVESIQRIVLEVFGIDRSVPVLLDRKSTRLNSSHSRRSRMPSSA